MLRRAAACALCLLLTRIAGAQESFAPRRTWPSPPATIRSAVEEARTFALADGFRAELFASEPMVQDPVALTFDEDGRLWVVEMRGFMPNLEGEGEDAPNGRISILEDTDGDGHADKSTIFLDGLVLPRALAVVRGGALVAHGGKLVFAADHDHDGRADEQTVIEAAYAHGLNPEHQPNGLLRALDNWIYNAKSIDRFRLIDGAWKKDRTEFRGQWGIAQDDFGRLYYNHNSDQLRADIVPPNTIWRNPHHVTTRGINVQVAKDQHTFPARVTTGVNRGYRQGSLGEDGRLLTFTAACAPIIYRGDSYPPPFAGNAFVLEPAAHLIKRTVVTESGLNLDAVFAYPDREFMTSTDERFRPVNVAVGPDGHLWIADMYRGILQHKAYISPYLRREIQARGLDKGIHYGRIWRILPPGSTPATVKADLGRASDARLVDMLSHLNGWWRDTAQRLLVERQARGVVPALLTLARTGPRPGPRVVAADVARVQALWTLEGLGLPPPDGLLPLVSDPKPRVRIAALRVVQSLGEGRPATAAALVRTIEKNARTPAPIEVDVQHALTLGALTRGEKGLATLLDIAARRGADPIARDAVMAGLADRERVFTDRVLAHPAFAAESNGLGPLLQALASALVKASPENGGHILALAAAQRKLPWRRRPLIAGIVENMVKLEETPLRFPARPPALDELLRTDDPLLRPLLAKLEPLLSWPGHESPAVKAPARKPPSIARAAMLSHGRDTYLTMCAPCHGQNGEGQDPMAPPLVGSEWVTGPPERLLRIVLRGADGPFHVRGELWEPPRVMPNMPAVEGIGDDDLAGVLTYIRDAYGRGAYDVSTSMVRVARDELRARELPFVEAELLKVDAGPPPRPTEVTP